MEAGETQGWWEGRGRTAKTENSQFFMFDVREGAKRKKETVKATKKEKGKKGICESWHSIRP